MRIVPLVSLGMSLVLSGCGLSPTATPTASTGFAIRGNVHGGQQPVVGAHVYLFAADATGYGHASHSLLNYVSGSTALDASGGATSGDYYVTTASDGSFTITGDYACTAGQQVYLYATGGDAGGGQNASASMLAILGNCPGGTSAFASQVPYVWMNEVTTIAAAYAFAGFATDATHVSTSSTAQGELGLANAFAAAPNLVDISTGAARSQPAALNGTVPQQEINTLANILASCINSNGVVTGPSSPSNCYTLFNNALSTGTTGTIPAETATAAINIAHYPAARVVNLYDLPVPTAAFAPALTAQPNDFTLAIQFTGGGLYDGGQVAIDASGNVWSTNDDPNDPTFTYGQVSELNPLGVPISTSAGYAPHTEPTGVAIDTAGYVWIANFNGSVTKLSSSGASVMGSPFSGGGLDDPFNLSIDPTGNVWVANRGSGKITELNGASGTPVSSTGYTDPNGGTGFAEVAIEPSGNVWLSDINNPTLNYAYMVGPTGTPSPNNPFPSAGGEGPLAIDNAGNVWIAGINGKTTELTSTGSPVFGSPFAAGGQCGFCSNAIAIDGAGNVWITDGAFEPPYEIAVTELNNAGAAVSPSTGYQTTLLTYPLGLAIDPSGNVWVADNGGPDIVEFVGAAVPVITPIAAGTATNTLGTRP